MLGSVMGDFVKGPINDEVRQRYGGAVTQAITLHRRIDSFTDAHPVVRESRNRISPERRRFAGIMIDLFYDHFLAKYWEEFHHRPLGEFTGEFYGILRGRQRELPERFKRVATFMVDLDWLGSYAHIESIDTALNRMSQRLRRDNTLPNSAEELVAHYAELELDFRRFFPEVLEFARKFRAA